MVSGVNTWRTTSSTSAVMSGTSRSATGRDDASVPSRGTSRRSERRGETPTASGGTMTTGLSARSMMWMRGPAGRAGGHRRASSAEDGARTSGVADGAAAGPARPDLRAAGTGRRCVAASASGVSVELVRHVHRLDAGAGQLGDPESRLEHRSGGGAAVEGGEDGSHGVLPMRWGTSRPGGSHRCGRAPADANDERFGAGDRDAVVVGAHADGLSAEAQPEREGIPRGRQARVDGQRVSGRGRSPRNP